MLRFLGVPLVAFHVALLLGRAMGTETMDAVVAIRWVLSIALMALLKQAASRVRSFRSPATLIAAILIFALIHAPVGAPEPGLPLAATGLGLALSLAVLDQRRRTLSVGHRSGVSARPAISATYLNVALATLKDRAPPLR